MPLIQDKQDILRFILGGKAFFTIENRATGGRFTYKAQQKKKGDIYWISLLNGPDNIQDYRFLGTVFPSGNGHMFRHSANGKISSGAPSAIAFTWFFNRLFSVQEFPTSFAFLPSSRCARCGRKLTVGQSVRQGFGDDCYASLF